jgi:hypothetical protein
MRIATDRRRKAPFAAHGSSGRSAHWLTTPCPIERAGGYRCVDDGITHDSEVRTEQYLVAQTGHGPGAVLTSSEAARIVDSLISLGALEPTILEHAGAYAAGRAKTDELPSIVTRRKGPGYVVRLRGCLRYRRHVLDLLHAIPGITFVRP